MPLGKKINPLLQAMKAPDEGNAQPRPELQAPRVMEFDPAEIAPAKNPGDPVTVYIYGTARGMSPTGKIQVSIDSVQPNQQEEVQEEKPQMVMTQESHVP